MPEQFRGLPTHILVIHAAVVLVPLGALGVLLLAAVPRWRSQLRWPVLATVFVGTVSVAVAHNTGEGFKRHLIALHHLGGPALALVDKHQRLAGTLMPMAAAMGLLTFGLFLVTRRPAARGGARVVLLVMAVLAVATSVVTTAQLVRVGEAGAHATYDGLQ